MADITTPRAGLLSSAVTFLGFGQGVTRPGAKAKEKKEPAADDDEMTAEEKEKKERREKEDARKAANVAAGRAEDDDGENGDDDDDQDGEEREDDEDDEDMKKGSKARGAREREKARIACILGHPSAKGREETAAHLALNTNMPRHQACRILASTPPARGPSRLAAAMESRAAVAVGPACATPTGQAKVDAMWDDVLAGKHRQP